MEIDVDVRGDKQAIALLDRLSRRLEHGEPQLLSLVDQLMAAQAERFMGRGQRWRKLAPSTLRQHRRRGRGAQPLYLTGALARSLTVRGARHQIVRVTPTSLKFGTKVWYAKIHHRGLGVPRRTVVGLTRVQKARIVEELRDLLIEDR